MKKVFTDIPYVGEKTAESLYNMGYNYLEDLKGKDPEELYLEDCRTKKFKEDKCQLYMFRMIVYCANHDEWDKEKLKWWYWKDK